MEGEQKPWQGGELEERGWCGGENKRPQIWIEERGRILRRVQGEGWSTMGIVDWLSGGGTRAEPTRLQVLTRVVEENDWRI